MFAIVDIETTGVSNQHNRITEIAILRHDGNKVIEQFHTLVNPQTWIPTFITQLTGISNEMVRHAPTFEQVADEVRLITKEAVFVAHNASFDYNFIKYEFARLDEYYHRDTLCTVKLCRKIFPGYRSYSLGNICRDLSVQHTQHHRALSDATATTYLFEKLIQHDEKGILRTWIND